jgi:hypothetical protein
LSSVVPRGTSYNSRKSELQVDSVPNDKAKNKKIKIGSDLKRLL